MTYFIIKGISDIPELQVPIFILVLIIYLVTLAGNMTILILVCTKSILHTPMYFFLGNLSVLDISSSTVTLHKLLINFLSGNNKVSFLGCMAQLYVFASLLGAELLILTAMSYDRYVAICKPLHYHMIMSGRVCLLLASACWAWGLLESLPHVYIISNFSFNGSKVINHFFCDFLPLKQLSCSDTSALELVTFSSGLFHSSFSMFSTFIPYIFIIVAILRIPSIAGRRKAFYTCSSHLTVVILLYVTLISQYMIPASINSLDSNKFYSLFNTAVVPMLNPLIYSLKNKDVKSALRGKQR
ncbi:olfactory receptor 1038-like [Bombina bombina]|uniref:olfactory receptor 1038-like n=1 Tax=Bombina bombina TaxID=8345 RepID=UPI00235A7F16|nr:olfactory receptor 1038-like [Bombina bombina]XP_053545620.1 olfactory receptor 1038-like [Bombina bombina]